MFFSENLILGYSGHSSATPRSVWALVFSITVLAALSIIAKAFAIYTMSITPGGHDPNQVTEGSGCFLFSDGRPLVFAEVSLAGFSSFGTFADGSSFGTFAAFSETSAVFSGIGEDWGAISGALVVFCFFFVGSEEGAPSVLGFDCDFDVSVVADTGTAFVFG
jgi:hypothetical protein